MLDIVRLTNFLSWEALSLEGLSKYRAITVIGDNGDGKSALLESLPFALFGEMRVKNLDDLIRRGAESTSVYLKFINLPKKGDYIEITRSKTKGRPSSTASLYLNGEREANGSAVADRIHELLGYDSSLFMLTSFFGLDASDTMMKAGPSAKLEDLQEIANVDIYKIFKKNVGDRLRQLDIDTAKLQAVVDEDEESTNEQESLSSLRTELKQATISLENEQAKQAALSGDMDRLNIFITERTTLQAQKVELESTISDLNDSLAEARTGIQESQDNIKEIAKQCNTLKDSVKKYNYAESVAAEEKANSNLAKLLLEYDLKKVATQLSGDKIKFCPLCKEPLKPNKIQDWKKNIVRLQTEIDDLRNSLENLKRDRRDNYEKLATKIRSYSNQLEMERTSLSTLDTRKEKYASKVNLKKSELFKVDQRLRELEDLISPIDASIDDYKALLDSICSYQSTVANLSYKIETIKTQKNNNVEKKKKLITSKKKLKTLKSMRNAYLILDEAWSRYGIPYNLLKGLRSSIEQRASKIYQRFDSGNIELLDTDEKGKPGIDYALHNNSGSFSYLQLSKGQKALLALTVRLAIADIVARKSQVCVDFLILDEMTENLSEKKRDRLMELICMYLKTKFNQVFMVSHSLVRNVFDCVISVDKVPSKSSNSEVSRATLIV